jgi:hypothetical protein
VKNLHVFEYLRLWFNATVVPSSNGARIGTDLVTQIIGSADYPLLCLRSARRGAERNVKRAIDRQILPHPRALNELEKHVAWRLRTR